MKLDSTMFKRLACGAVMFLSAGIILSEQSEDEPEPPPMAVSSRIAEPVLPPAADLQDPTTLRGTIQVDGKTPITGGEILLYSTVTVEGIEPGTLLAKGKIRNGKYLVRDIPGTLLPPNAELRVAVRADTQGGPAGMPRQSREAPARSDTKEGVEGDKRSNPNHSHPTEPTKGAKPKYKSLLPVLQASMLMVKVNRLYGMHAPKRITTRINRGDNLADFDLNTINPPMPADFDNTLNHSKSPADSDS